MSYNILDRPLWVRFINAIGGPLRALGMKSLCLDFESLSKAAGFRPTVEDEAFLSRFNIILDEANRSSEIHFTGRFLLRQYYLNVLRNRALIHQWLRDHPETLQIPIEHPLFIVGDPRTGTTLLYNLLAQDPASRAPLLWELFQIAPPHDPSDKKPSPNIKKTEKLLRRLNWYYPSIAIAHQIEACAPEECEHLMLYAAFYPDFETIKCPRYTDHMLNVTQEEQLQAYAEYNQQIQILQYYSGNRRWLSKNCKHLYYLEALSSTFPTAHLVCTHRDPFEQIPSLCSLFARTRAGLTDEIDLKDIGKKVLRWWRERYDRSEKARQTMGHRVIDVTYTALKKDPIGLIKEIYEKVDYPFTEIFNERMRAWLAAHPQHKHGVHRYSLEQFGLDRSEVEEVTREYRQKYLM